MAWKNVVAVTGATGFIASYLVKDLLERGYTVRGTVRNPDDVSKVGFLLALPGAKERLTLYKADLLEEGSFDTVVDGVGGVFHTASPFSRNPKDPQAELIDPAVKGTLNLVQAAAKAKTVKRVVLTSSIVAMIWNTKPRTATTVVDESWWSDPEFCRETGAWYPLSKTLAEQAAWDFVKGRHFDLVTVNPFVVIGTMLQPTLNATNKLMIESYLSGEIKKCANAVMGFVDVQDVSLAHILAYENPEAEGRYLLVDCVVHLRELAEKLSTLYPGYPVHTELDYDPKQETPGWIPNTEKARKLGISYRPLESQLVDAVTSLQQQGHLDVLNNNSR